VDPDAVKRARARAKKEGAGAVDTATVEPPTDEEIMLAARYMRGAMERGTDAATFAQSARQLIPSNIFAYIRHVGVDDFLNRVAILDPSSPLTDQVGRKFARDVAKALLGGAP
jgi:hypothetical protein